MTAAILGPDPELLDRCAVLGHPLQYFRATDVVPDDAWSGFDGVVLDLMLFRVSTSETEVDMGAASPWLIDVAGRNPDAFWLLICPPALVGDAHRLSRSLAKHLRGGIEATEVAQEPHEVARVLPRLRAHFDEIARIDAIPVSIGGTRPLTPAETRCIRRLLANTDRADLEPLGDGQGSALVLLAASQLDGGQAPPRVLKVGPESVIRREHDNYLQFARHRLGLNRCPAHDTEDVWFAGTSGALSYSFAGGESPKSLTEIMRAGDGCPPLEDLWTRVMAPWLGMREASTEPIGAFIRSILDGVSLDQAEEFWAATAEPPDETWNPIPWLRSVGGRITDVTLPHSIAHGDLHGYNILVDDAGKAWLIDFYRTGRRSGLYDFAFCDAALMLHRTVDQTEAVNCTLEELVLGEDDYYAGGNPVRAELAVVRSEALRVWGGASVALFHLARACAAIRRLKFDTTDAAKAKVIAARAAQAARGLAPAWEAAEEIGPIEF